VIREYCRNTRDKLLIKVMKFRHRHKRIVGTEDGKSGTSSNPHGDGDSLSQTNTTLQDSEDEDSNGEIWYFGYGPIVNAAVRERRGVQTSQEQPAILPNHRLTFAYGGVASIVPMRGYLVHGVLMKVDTPEDWVKMQKFDSGQYEAQRRRVYPYDLNKLEDPADTYEEEITPVRCHVFVQSDYEVSLLEKPLEKKPQERYLRLIAQGMQKVNADPNYVENEIMGCPYVEMRTQEEWLTFSHVSNKKNVPKISMDKYQRICQKASPDDCYFILRNHVIQLHHHDPENPSAKWIRSNGHGNPDISFLVHTIVVDPDVPYAGSEEGMTDLHYRWAENHMVDFCQQAQIEAFKIYRLKGGGGNVKDTPPVTTIAATSITCEQKKPGQRRGSVSWPKSLHSAFSSSDKQVKTPCHVASQDSN